MRYAIIVGKCPGTSAQVTSLAQGQAPARKITSVTMLGSAGKLNFSQDAAGLKVDLPATQPCEHAYVLKITGLQLNAPTWTESGNPVMIN